jgi:glycosyltransferase involved in cell wall biosynthesis
VPRRIAKYNRFTLRLLKPFLLHVPSRRLNPFEGSRGKVRLLATTMVRDDARFLPAMLRNVAAQVDGIIALDDGSTDGSDRLLEKCPAVLELLRNPPDRPHYDEPGGHRRLVEAALRHGAEWIMSVDADERLERDFRVRAERVIRRAQRLGLEGFSVRTRDVWDSPNQYRVDGIWGRKSQPRLFRASADHEYDPRALHGAKTPLQARVFGMVPLADLFFYHFRMLHPEDRSAPYAI